MEAKVTLDKAGRVVLPKTLREELRLNAGDTLQIESEGERITLRPVRAQAMLKKELGVWVYQGGLPEESIVEQIDRDREERIRSFLE
jgi:AbrB family looped-hinge helix DNA binding protein